MEPAVSRSPEERETMRHLIREPGSGKLYRRGTLLGKGAFGRCYKFTDTTTNQVYAVKIVTSSRICQQRRKGRVEREIELHSRLMHKNIVDFHCHFQDQDNIYMILEYCSHKSLAHILKARKLLTEPEVRYYLQEIITGVRYLHQQSIIHRDLKLSNFFITKKMEVKIGDLGLATTKEHAERTGGLICGTPNYLAPEVIAKKGHSFKSDIWALGCIMYTLLTGSSPFKCQPLKEMYQSIRQGSYTIPSHVSANAQSLINSLLASNPAERPSLDEILRHSFFTQGYTPERLPSRACHSTPTFTADNSVRKFFKKAAKVFFRQMFITDPHPVHRLPRELKRSETQVSCPQNSCKLSSSDTEALVSGTEETLSERPNNTILRLQNQRPPESETETQRERLKWNQNWSPVKVLMRGTLNNSEADGSLERIVGSVSRVLRCCLENMPQANQGLRDLMDCPVLWVTKWVDYSNKYGFGYQLSDHCTGVLLRDGSHMALYPHLQRVCYCAGSQGSISFPRKSSPSPLAMKIGILNFFSQYMEQRLLEGGDLHAAPSSTVRDLTLLHFLKSDQALLMVFSNGTVQVNFYNDHTKLILSRHRGEFLLTYINQRRLSATMPLDALIRHGCSSPIRQRMAYAAALLQHL